MAAGSRPLRGKAERSLTRFLGLPTGRPPRNVGAAQVAEPGTPPPPINKGVNQLDAMGLVRRPAATGTGNVVDAWKRTSCRHWSKVTQRPSWPQAIFSGWRASCSDPIPG